MGSVPLSRSLRRLIITFMLLAVCGVTSVSAASRPAPPRVAQNSSGELDQILRENALFFNILVSFSYTLANSDPAWGLGVKNISVNLITRNVRDPNGRQMTRVRVAGVVRKNNNVELNILNPAGQLVGKGFYGFNSGQLIFFNPNDKPIITGYSTYNGSYILNDLRLPQGNQNLANGYVDPCFDCDSLRYAWYDGLNIQVGGGQMYPSFSYDSDGYLNDVSMYWSFEKGQISDSVNATGEAEFDLSSEATGAINNVLFDTDRTAESFFANPYGLLPEPEGKALLPRFSNDTSIAVTNTAGRKIRVTYVARNFDGSLISGEGIENPITYVFANGQQFSAYPGELFRGLNETDRRPILAEGAVGWMEVYSYEGDIQAMFFDSNRSGSAFDGNIGAESGGNPIVFPDLRLNADESTEIELLNLAYDDVMVRLQLLDAGGNVLREEPEYFIAGSGIRSFQIGGGSKFLRTDDPSLAASLRVSCNNKNSLRSSSCSKIVGFATTADRFGSIASAFAVTAESAGSFLIGPYFVTGASGKGEWETTVRVTKFDGAAGLVYLELYDAKGSLLAALPKILTPGGQADFVLLGSTLPWGDRLSSGYVRLFSDSGTIAGDVSITWSDGVGSQLTTYPLSNNLYRVLQFNQVAQGNVAGLDYWTGIALVNDLDKPVKVNVEVFRSDGGKDRSAVITLNSHEQHASLLPDFVEDPRYELIGGYIRISSADPVSAIMLYGDSAGKFLAAIPGIPLESTAPVSPDGALSPNPASLTAASHPLP
jgi:hypothetical protein